MARIQWWDGIAEAIEAATEESMESLGMMPRQVALRPPCQETIA